METTSKRSETFTILLVIVRNPETYTILYYTYTYTYNTIYEMYYFMRYVFVSN